MDHDFTRDDPIANTHTDEADIVMSFMDTPGDHDYGQYTLSRYIRANIIDEDDDGDVVVEITAFDNVNGGMFSMGGIMLDAPGGEQVEHTDTTRIPRETVEERIVEQLKAVQTISERVVPEVKTWARETEFKSEPEPYPEEAEISW
jgi:GTPase Era involved in 16S rRNA processing